MSKLCLISLIIEILSLSSIQAATYGGGSGTEADPYQIRTPEQMNTIGINPDDWDKNFKLMNDIDMSAYTGTEYNIIGNLPNRFIGTFDGSGSVIYNFTYEASEVVNNVGIFGIIGIGGQVSNLTVENVSLSAGNVIGGVAGGNSGVIHGCCVTGSISGNGYIGGLAGDNRNTITACHAAVSVSGTGDYIGGLVGCNDYLGILSACYATGNVAGTGQNSDGVGGLVGYNFWGEIIACYATGTVSSTGFCIGGLVGDGNIGSLIACYATGAVSGSSSVGGLVGNGNLAITACYSTGLVSGTGDFIGGFMGSGYYIFSACFWDVQTSGLTKGLGGKYVVPFGLTGLNTEEMMTPSTFIDAGWDLADESANGFHDFWQMDVIDYPHLAIDTWTLEGDGTSANPYIISDAVDLGRVCLRPAAHYCLSRNLDLGGLSLMTAIVPTFAGSFNGCGFVISNFTINLPDIDNVGLFGHICHNAYIQNLGAENFNIVGRSSVGGLVGRNDDSVINACCANGSVNKTDYSAQVGGLLGSNASGTVTSCYAGGSVTADGGGGGLVGYNAFWSKISNCYSTSTILGDSGKGLVGYNEDGCSVIASFWDLQASGRGSSAAGTSKTTAEMMTKSTFTSAGWDFTNETANGTANIWRMCADGVDYPRLNWESTKGDFTCPDGVNLKDMNYYTRRWLLNDCTPDNNYCGGADLDFSGVVDLTDFSLFADNWLAQ